ncbi:Ig-like domain-containing protein [Streptomyces sp. CA-243310]|uniref:Ig-like domain-containing protein n=1 Tax=Streptomyces sp. CA-243310 TaxID=3240056 RepID=UPI003D8B3B42
MCATVTAVGTRQRHPTGTVTFTGPGGLNETVTLDAGGTACLTTTALETGTVTATYNGDGCFLLVQPHRAGDRQSGVEHGVGDGGAQPVVCGEAVTVCARRSPRWHPAAAPPPER